MLSLATLCASAALTHSVCGAKLNLKLDDGREMQVGHHPTCDVNPCALRFTIANEINNGNPSCFANLKQVTLEGSLQEVGPGIYKAGAGFRYYFASHLIGETVREIIDNYITEHAPPKGIDAAIRYDSQLGVSTVCIAAVDPRVAEQIELITCELAAICVASELANTVLLHSV